MKIIKKNILLISPEPWDHIFVSKHHYALTLGNKGNKIFFLNPPNHKENEIHDSTHKNIKILDYTGFVSGIRFLPSFLQRYFMRRKFEELQTLSGVSFDIIWSFDNSVFFDFNALPPKPLKISHIVDLNQDFNTEKAASTANICIGVIPEIVERLSKFNSQTLLIPHGVNYKDSYSKQISLPGDNKFKALYSGNMDMPYIDWSLIAKLIKQFSTVDFIFLGSMNKGNTNLSPFLQKNNVHYLPAVSSDKVQNYLNAADVLLVAYTKKYYSNYASPHKMLEYLASGKMIIATWTKEYIDLYKKGILSMNKSTEEYIDNFKRILSTQSYNSSDKIKARKAYALENTYDKQLRKIESYLEHILSK